MRLMVPDPKEDSGRWHLVDQNGRLGKLIDVEEDEYVSVLYGSTTPNQPRGLVLFDSNDRERGVLFLADFGGDQTPNHDLETKLAVDFGTSNTSLAYSFNNGQPETLRFQLTSPPDLGGETGCSHRATRLLPLRMERHHHKRILSNHPAIEPKRPAAHRRVGT